MRSMVIFKFIYGVNHDIIAKAIIRENIFLIFL